MVGIIHVILLLFSSVCGNMYKSIGCRLNEQIFGFRKECVIKLGQKFVKYGIHTHTDIQKTNFCLY